MLHPPLQNAVGKQVVQGRVGALDNQRRQGGDGHRRTLDNAVHQRLKARGSAVELILNGCAQAHVTADQVGIPAHPDADALHIAGLAYPDRAATAHVVEHMVADDLAGGLIVVVVDRPGWPCRLPDDRRCQRHGQQSALENESIVHG